VSPARSTLVAASWLAIVACHRPLPTEGRPDAAETDASTPPCTGPNEALCPTRLASGVDVVRCVSTRSNESCGGCYRACDVGEHCDEGTCTRTSPAEDLRDACKALRADPAVGEEFPGADAYLCGDQPSHCEAQTDANACHASAACSFDVGFHDCPPGSIPTCGRPPKCNEAGKPWLAQAILRFHACSATGGTWRSTLPRGSGGCDCGATLNTMDARGVRGCVTRRTLCKEAHGVWEPAAVRYLPSAECRGPGLYAQQHFHDVGICTVDPADPIEIPCTTPQRDGYERKRLLLKYRKAEDVAECVTLRPDGGSPAFAPRCITAGSGRSAPQR
jgi:hypothetical protein